VNERANDSERGQRGAALRQNNPRQRRVKKKKKYFDNRIMRGMSAEELEDLSEQALEMAKHLKEDQPTYELALMNGVEDWSYYTVRFGMVRSYRGESLVAMGNGTKWRCIGHPPALDENTISHNGWIEMIPFSLRFSR
jgi:hypothetical protein